VTTGTEKWYLIMSKPNKDAYAEEQLSCQGYIIYRPVISVKKKVRGKIKKVEESLFPRYLFVQLKAGVDDWSPIRSTRGVLSIVRFGIIPAEVPNRLIQLLKQKENKNTAIAMNMNRFKQGEKIIIESGPFAGIEAVFKSYKGEERVIVLLNILSNISTLSLSLDMIEKVN